MHKKTLLHGLDVPINDDECWARYPKHRWVYDMSRLLDSQNISWHLYSTNEQNCAHRCIDIVSKHDYKSGEIYTKTPEGAHLFTEVFIVKGEVKAIRHIDPNTNLVQSMPVGEIELRINAFVTLHFQKFTGIITTETFSNEIFRVHLRARSDLSQETNNEIIRLLKRIYKRTDSTVSGLTDRVFHESLAS